MTNKKLNGVHVCESSEKQRACHQGQVKARPRDASGTGMKNQKLDAAEVWRQMEDLAAPQLRQTVHERAVYSYLPRHSRIEGKVRLRFSISWLRHGAGLPIRAARKAKRGLAAKGALRVVGRGREGHVVEVRLPEEIRGVHAREITGDRAARAREIDNLEAADFLGGPELREAIHRREGGRCFDCGRQLSLRTRCLDQVVPLAHLGGNSYRNLVSSCRECNSLKRERQVPDFLRWLFREGHLSRAELSGRLRAVEQLAAGKLRPVIAGDREATK
jgi:hypothetical protein